MQYVQLKSKVFLSNGKRMKMLRIIDVTPHILYNEFKARAEFTSIINACVSHELRNPLNSIMAKNIEKSALYQELRRLLESLPSDVKRRIFFSQFEKIMNQLEDGKRIQ